LAVAQSMKRRQPHPTTMDARLHTPPAAGIGQCPPQHSTPWPVAGKAKRPDPPEQLPGRPTCSSFPTLTATIAPSGLNFAALTAALKDTWCSSTRRCLCTTRARPSWSIDSSRAPSGDRHRVRIWGRTTQQGRAAEGRRGLGTGGRRLAGRVRVGRVAGCRARACEARAVAAADDLRLALAAPRLLGRQPPGCGCSPRHSHYR
jgi:hypothetical protein